MKYEIKTQPYTTYYLLMYELIKIIKYIYLIFSKYILYKLVYYVFIYLYIK